MKKRAAAFLLAGILSMSMLAGCGSGNDGQRDTANDVMKVAMITDSGDITTRVLTR